MLLSFDIENELFSHFGTNEIYEKNVGYNFVSISKYHL